MRRWISSLGLVAVLSGGALPAQRSAAKEDIQVAVVPIEGTIDVSTVALVQRALREAESEGIPWVVLELNTPGGFITSMREVEALLSGVQDREVQTVAYVRQKAWSAGAYLALACDRTFMAPGTTIGAITPILVQGGRAMEIPDETVRRKTYSAMRGLVRALLEERNRRDPDHALSQNALTIAEAMVDPDLAYVEVMLQGKDGMQEPFVLPIDEVRRREAQGAKVVGEVLRFSRPVTLTNVQAERLGFSTATVASLQALVEEEFNVPMSSVRRYRETWSERAGQWIDSFKPFLFLVGFLLLVVELKSPGFAVPGVLGISILSIALFGSYLTGLASWVEILLLLGGFGLLAVELFLVPGLLVPGITGFLCIVMALVLSQQSFAWPQNEVQGEIMFGNLLSFTILLLVLIACSVLLWKYLPRTWIGRRVLLEPPRGAYTGASTQFARPKKASALAGLVGREGVAASTLRPAGIVEVGGQRLDVVAVDGFVPAGTPVRVTEIQGNRIVVEAVEERKP